MQDLSSEELFKAVLRLVKNRKYWDALSSIKMAIKKGGYEGLDNIPPIYLSYLGLATALAEKRYREGAELCEMAIRKEFYNPLYYLNLGKVYSAGGYRFKAINAFYNGLEIDKGHSEILAELKKMGMRRKPVIFFLPRANVLNKYLGYFLHKKRA